MPDISQKSNKILHGNLAWLLLSDIRIKEGHNKGALYGWKSLSPPIFPFIYSEITGYAITCFTWITSEFGNLHALEAAKQASSWISRNMHSNLLFARPEVKDNESNDLSKVFYSFDNGMVLVGLLNLYTLTKEMSLLQTAQKMANALIERFFDGDKLISRLDKSFNPLSPSEDEGVVKWSTISGAYHCKVSPALIELHRLTNNEEYLRVSDSICDYARHLQRSNGQFVTNPGSEVVYLHPHLYACEGLIYSGIKQSNEIHYNAGLKGIEWAVKHISLNTGGLIRDTGKKSVEQSDCTAQLLRLIILSQLELENSFSKSELKAIIEKLHSRLLDFYIPTGEAKGAMKYQLALDTACSWCTMFSAQALKLWETKNSPSKWINYFV